MRPAMKTSSSIRYALNSSRNIHNRKLTPSESCLLGCLGALFFKKVTFQSIRSAKCRPAFGALGSHLNSFRMLACKLEVPAHVFLIFKCNYAPFPPVGAFDFLQLLYVPQYVGLGRTFRWRLPRLPCARSLGIFLHLRGQQSIRMCGRLAHAERHRLRGGERNAGQEITFAWDMDLNVSMSWHR